MFPYNTVLKQRGTVRGRGPLHIVAVFETHSDGTLKIESVEAPDNRN